MAVYVGVLAYAHTRETTKHGVSLPCKVHMHMLAPDRIHSSINTSRMVAYYGINAGASVPSGFAYIDLWC